MDRTVDLHVDVKVKGFFVVGSLAWGVVLDGFRPDRFDAIGAAVCLAGAALIMFAPRSG